MFADRGAIWSKVEILRRSMAQQGLTQQSTNQFGRAADFSLLEPASADVFRRDCEAAAQLPLAQPVAELFRQAHEAGIEIVLVEMPMRGSHRARFYETKEWNDYTSHLLDLLRLYNIKFVDASGWAGDDALFEDPLHLSQRGATIFSQRIAEFVSARAAQIADLR
jgi:lysophospholipase L1-like esterase